MKRQTQNGSLAVDGVELAVMANRYRRIIGNMVNTLLRTGRSGVLTSARDFSCSILTRKHRLLFGADSLPIHMLGGPDLMAETMAQLHPDLRAGDAFLHNSPYHGNSHPADFGIVIPVVDGEGGHHFTVLAKAHVADCGNALPTTYSAAAKDVYEEGALIFPCVKVQENYRDREDIIRMCKLRIRVPELWWGDYLAILGAARIGEKYLLRLGEEFGWDRLHAYAAQWFDYSEGRMIDAIRRLPSGKVTVTNTHDPLPGLPEGLTIKAKVTVDPKHARIEVDLRDNPDCQPCGLNLSEATARSAALLGIFNSIGGDVPPNAGSFRRLSILLRENCVVGIPRHPSSCSVATTNLADHVANAVQHALADLGEGLGMAEVAGGGLPPSVGVISGRDPRKGGAPFINEIFLASTGGAATPWADAWLTTGHVGSAGMTFQDSIELDELRFPIRVYQQRIIPDSEGAGCFRGAPGVCVEYGPVGTDLTIAYASDGTHYPAMGVRGGLPGSPTQQFRRDADGKRCDIPAYGEILLHPGERIVCTLPGGGGYRSPLERDPQRVLQDIREGFISAERAREVYGVVLEGEARVDQDATRTQRADLHRRRRS
jgi:N-methylhydantoinase B